MGAEGGDVLLRILGLLLWFWGSLEFWGSYGFEMQFISMLLRADGAELG